MPERIGLAREFLRHRPDAAARVLESHPPDAAAAVLSSVTADVAAPVAARMLSDRAANALGAMDVVSAVTLIRELEPTPAAAILRRIGEERRRNILSELPTAKAVICKLLLRFGESEIGAWIDPHPLTVADDATADAAIQRFRDAPPDCGDLGYVVNRDGRLRGVVRLRNLLGAEAGARAATVMRRPPAALPGRAAVDSVLDDPAWETADELPVVDGTSRFIGVVRHADLRKAAREPAETSDGDLTNALLAIVTAYWSSIDDLVRAGAAALSRPTASKGPSR